MIKVYGVHGSPFVRKVLICLRVKGLDYEMVAQMPFTGDKDYLKINTDGAFAISQVRSIRRVPQDRVVT